MDDLRDLRIDTWKLGSALADQWARNIICEVMEATYLSGRETGEELLRVFTWEGYIGPCLRAGKTREEIVAQIVRLVQESLHAYAEPPRG